MNFVVSTGHAEYDIKHEELIEGHLAWARIEDMTVEVLRGALTRDFSDIPGWNDTAAMTGESTVTVNDRDYDLNYEWFVGWYGPRGWIEQKFEELFQEIAGGPTGADDDTFDYWPSGVRYLQQVADQLGTKFRVRVDAMARANIMTKRPEFADELLNSVGLT